MAGGNNQKKKKKNKNKKKNRPGKKETENEERNTMFQFVWGFLLLCISSALISGVHILNWITRMAVLLFFHRAWMCLQSGLHILARVLSICLSSLILVLPWTIWLFVLIEGADLGFSSTRLIVLAVPVIMSKWCVRCMKLMGKNMWLFWMLRLVQSVANLAVDAEQHGLAVDLKSVGEYLDQHPPTMSHPTYQFQIPTREGLNLWQGFLDVVLNAYEGNASWAGTFTEECLKMSGSECIIEMTPSYPATFENLLLDLAQLATLLVEYFQTPNLLAPKSIQQLYSSMTTPWLGPVPVPSAQQIEKFLKFMRNQPSLKPARKSNTFLSKVFQASRAMGQNEKAIFVAAVRSVQVPAGWADTVFESRYRLINRTLCYRGHNLNNEAIVYQDGPEEVFRFLRNFFEHGGDTKGGRQMLWDMEDLDYLAAEVFSDTITALVWHVVMNVEMSGLLVHAWEDYQ